ncbi:hypothetical protein SDC9_20885 [bioreactor metagenome]|uniref:Uncharacterized protein n=1 Tax=bioreactor metagenome TaxID=1076179 RepID=A0A644U7Y7_9ZZZZ|nr:hypothetical protein [Negativicutes bacterium]
METIGNSIGIIWMIATGIIGTAVFLKMRYIYFGDVAKGMFSAWLSCVVGAGVVLGIIGWIAGAIVLVIISFIISYWISIVGGIILLVGLGVLGNMSDGDNPDQASNNKVTMKKIGLIACCAGVIIFAFGIFGHSSKEAPKTAPVATVPPVVQSAGTGNAAMSKPNIPGVEDAQIQKAQNILGQYNIATKVVATSLGKNPNGFLALTKHNESYTFVIVDDINKQAALVPFSADRYNLCNNYNKGNIPPIIFEMLILNDKHDRDEKAGIWNGPTHNIPIYALYKFDANGIVKPGMLSTGQGATPSHYQGVLNEKKNVDIANLFLTEMKTLQENAKARQIAVPAN